MELFNDLVIPVGSSHLTLIRLMLYISATFIFAYSGLLFGSVFLSISASKKAKKLNDFRYQKLAQEMIQVGTGITGMWFGLCIVPLLSFILGYPQFLHGTESDVVGYLIIAFFLFIISIGSIYIYKNSIDFKSLFYSFKTNARSTSMSVVEEYQKKDEEIENNYTFTSIFGIIFLVIAIWFFSGATTYAYDSALWGQSIFKMLFNWNVVMKLLLILSMGIAFASAIYMFLSFSWQGGKEFANHDEKELFKNFARKYGLNSSLLIPLFYAFVIVTIPNNALSGLLFVLGLISLLFVVFYTQSMYLTKKVDHIQGIKYGFAFIMIAFATFSALDQEAFYISVAKNLNSIIMVHNKIEEEREASYTTNKVEPVIDAQAIYETRCIACHKFDQKLVGPAYNDVVPLFKGREADLAKFIQNPTPQNPKEFPAGMPNQGMTAAQSKALAKWLLEKVLGDQEGKEATPASTNADKNKADEKTANKTTEDKK